MSEPRIKQEQSPESPISAIPSEHGSTIATLFAASHTTYDRSADVKLPTKNLLSQPNSSRGYHEERKHPPGVKIEREATDVAPATDRETTPQEYTLGRACHASGLLGTRPPPLPAWLSSRPISAVATQQQTVALNKIHLQSCILARDSIVSSPRVLIPRHTARRSPQAVVRAGNMDPFKLADSNGLGVGQELDFNALGTFPSMFGAFHRSLCRTRAAQWR